MTLLTRQLRVPLVILIAVALVAGYKAMSRVGYSTVNVTQATRTDIELYNENRERFMLAVGDSVAIDACANDGQRGDMYFFVHECTSDRPELFQWTIYGDSVVRLQNRKLYGLKPGRFSIKVSALGHSDSLAGEILAPVSLELSVYDTTLHLGDELVVGSRVTTAGRLRHRVDQVDFYNPSAGAALWEEPLQWAYPPARRLLARGLGVTCLGLSGYSRITWLKVAVVDSSGLSRSDGKPIDPRSSWFDCQKSSLYRPVVQPVERAPAPQPALADSDIAAGAKKAFAYQRCVARAREKGDTGNNYDAKPALRRCGDSVAAMSPDWKLRDADDYLGTAIFGHPVSNDSAEQRSLVLNFRQGTLEFREFRPGPPYVYGMSATVGGNEYPAILAAAACAELLSSRTGKPAPTIDSLLDFANLVWLASTPGDRPAGCKAELLRFRPRAVGERADTRVHESGAFLLRYSHGGGQVIFTIRPARWAETGVFSYRRDGSSPMIRTTDNRDPRVGDEFLDPSSMVWSLRRPN